MYLPDGTPLREDYYIIHGPNQDPSEHEGMLLSKYARTTSVTWNCLGMVTLTDHKCPKCPKDLQLNFALQPTELYLHALKDLFSPLNIFIYLSFFQFY